jgi:hypothetical protein
MPPARVRIAGDRKYLANSVLGLVATGRAANNRGQTTFFRTAAHVECGKPGDACTLRGDARQ